MRKPIAAQIKDAERLMEKRASAAVSGLMLELAKRIVERTPVDTGRARSNWQAATGSPDRSTSNDTGNVALMRAQNTWRQVAIDQKLYFTNSLPYIVPLEYGHSRQAPGGMVRVSMAELSQMARTVAAMVRRN